MHNYTMNCCASHLSILLFCTTLTLANKKGFPSRKALTTYMLEIIVECIKSHRCIICKNTICNHTAAANQQYNK